MMKNRIIICGYPKSGNTWLTRLTAEIINCPVIGFWCEPFNHEEAIEGLDRDSNYECFKAHHNLHDMNYTLKYYGNDREKIIYIVRDPRDVIVSAYHHFSRNKAIPYRILFKIMSITSYTSRKYEELFNYWTKNIESEKLKSFTRKLLEGGSKKDNYWLRTPWKEHVLGYLNSGMHIVKYEDLKINPLDEARKICEYLSIDRTNEQLSEAIANQSIDKKRSLGSPQLCV